MTTVSKCTTLYDLERVPQPLPHIDPIDRDLMRIERAQREMTSMTFPQVRGRLISTMMREYSPADLAEKLLELDPSADVERSSARSLASRIAWKLLP